jgi:hypothetical protein
VEPVLLGDFAEKRGVGVGAARFSVFAGGVQAGQRAVGWLLFVGCFTGDLPWNLSTGRHQGPGHPGLWDWLLVDS